MKLNKEQLGKMIHNVLSYDYDEKGRLYFRRFTEHQRHIYEKESKDYLLRANTSAGVTFDFVTDSEYFVLDIDIHAGFASWSNFDLYVDGIYTAHRKFTNTGQKLISFSLPKGCHRVTLYFPWSMEVVINAVYLSDGATITEVSKRAKAIIFGDSITQGFITEYTSLTYANQVAREMDIELLNQGVGGYYFGSDSIDEALISYEPNFIIIAYGTNDYSRYDTREEFQTHVLTYMEKLTSLFPNTEMLAILPIYRNDENHQAREKYRDYTLDEAKQILLDIYAKYDHIHVLKETGIPHISEVFAEDYLHPNALGFTFMAKAIEYAIYSVFDIKGCARIAKLMEKERKRE